MSRAQTLSKLAQGLVYDGTSNLTVGSITVGRGAGSVSTNTAVGASALAANTTGSSNTAVGLSALSFNTTGTTNSAFGLFALRSNTTGSNNTAVGEEALWQNTTASNNTALGYQAGYSNLVGADNVYLGHQAGYASTDNNNTFSGARAGRYTTTGANITAVGYVALNSNTTGSNNTALGSQALISNTTGLNNTAVGYQAAYSNTAGIFNVAMGYQAGYSNTTATGNIFFGHQAGFSFNSAGSITNTSGNIVIGMQAGYALTTGSANVIIGSNNSTYTNPAGYGLTSGNVNTFIGCGAGQSATTGSGNTFIGTGSGGSVTTGASNTILGRYNGFQGGLDIRTSNNYIVLSDGDGNPQIAARTGRSVSLEGAVPQIGTGITFPATQNPSSNANTLDDYEEGTWTPILTASSPPTGVTYNAQGGTYTKVGRMVTIVAGLNIASTGSGGSGELRVSGLPFAAIAAGAFQEARNVVGAGNLNNAANAGKAEMFAASGSTYLSGRVNDNSDTVWNYSDLKGGSLSTGSFIKITLTYFTN